ncbi:flavin-containing monooxygenase [Nocardia pseudovaccinii]|uniref:flavin-containing monooxygenase n=1 Tax=Nocardia pseudovaccinii TaxID=189540 RepID=UPI0007C87197|nr:NAD(P)/FAD-dependent oxidoreductase [Nocardia pseudovaccinii]
MGTIESVKVVIIGAGFGGLGMGAELRTHGVEDFVILEASGDLGGVWRENIYPGCGCDVPSHEYSFDFQPYRSPAIRFPGQREILRYLHQVADRQGLRPHLRLDAAASSAEYDDHTGRWMVSCHSGQRYLAETVVCAVGMLHRPHIPDIPGRDSFAGITMHTAAWDHSHDLTGRHVAVIGTGSSAAQLVPEIADQAERVTVYQRTPNWVLPKPRAQFSGVQRWAMTRWPGLHPLYRSAIHLAADVGLAPIMTRGWSARPAQWIARAYLRRHITDPTLRTRLTPSYRLGEKRILVDSGYYPALTRPTVELVTAGIDHLTPDGIYTRDGSLRRADAVIYATGFRASEFLADLDVRGREGQQLHQRWAAGAEAYLGVAVPGFPGLYLVHGPGTFLSSGSNVRMKQASARYIAACIRLRDRLGTPIDVRAEEMARYQHWRQQALARTVWPNGTAPTWYKDPAGRPVTLWPATARLYEQLTRRDPAQAFLPVTVTPTQSAPTGPESSQYRPSAGTAPSPKAN